MAGPERNAFRFPSYAAGFRGLLLREGITDEAFQGGFLVACTNFHLIGRGRLKKRRGHKRLTSTLPSGVNPIQGLAMYEFGTTRKLVTVVNGKIMWLNSSTWTDATGTLTPGTGANNLVRFTQFSQGAAGAFLVGTGPNNTALWKWAGSGNATALVGAGLDVPGYAQDIEQFFGRLWVVNTDNGNTICEYSDDGRADLWPNENSFHADRGSPAVGLCRHNDGMLLVFHQRSIHRVEPVYDSTFGDPFGRYLVDNSVGAESTHSIVNAKGATYFAGKQGFYRIRDAHRPAEYIGWPIEDYWNDLNPARTPNIVGFERGEPWNEIVWLVSTGTNTTNNAAIVYNIELDAWTIFEQSSGALAFNHGCNFTNSDGKEVTICGGYTGIISKCWGDDNFIETGNVDAGDDDQSPVTSVFKTGALGFGYEGLKRLREIWLDLQLSDMKSFQISIKGIADNPSVSLTQEMGEPAAAFGSFVFGVSKFSGNDPIQAKIVQSAKARLFQTTIQESDDGPPYTLNAVRFWWLPRGNRIKAIA